MRITVLRSIWSTAVCAVAFGAAQAGAATGQETDAGQPGAEHRHLAALAGRWNVMLNQPAAGTMVQRGAGTAEARLRLGARFLEIEVMVDGGPIRQAIYTLAFDRRHGTYDIVVFDNTGTYFVTASSDSMAKPPTISLYGVDDDPMMASMGLDKEFVFVVDLESEDRFSIETRFVDTRTPAREEHPFMTLEFTRADSN